MSKIMSVVLTATYAVIYIAQHHFGAAWYEYILALLLYLFFMGVCVIGGNDK